MSSAIARRPASASGITTWGHSGSGGRGITVHTAIVRRISNRVYAYTAGAKSSIVARDEVDLGPSGDIDSPIEANSIEAKVGVIDTIT